MNVRETAMSAPCPRFGFKVSFRDATPHSGDVNSLVDDIIGFLDQHGLLAQRRGSELIVTREGSQATDSDRRLVIAWADQRPDHARIEVGDLRDIGEAA